MKKLGAGATAKRVIHTLGVLAMVVMFELMLTFFGWLVLEGFAPAFLPLSRTAGAMGVAAAGLTALAFTLHEWMERRDLAWVAAENGVLLVGRGARAPRRFDDSHRLEVVVKAQESTGRSRRLRFWIMLKAADEEFVLLPGGGGNDAAELISLIRQALPRITVNAPEHPLALPDLQLRDVDA